MSTENTPIPASFSTWIASMSDKASDTNKAAMEELKKQIQEQAAEKLKARGLAVFSAIQENLKSLRRIRAQEQAVKKQLDELNALGDALVAGQIDEEEFDDFDRSISNYGSTSSSAITQAEILSRFLKSAKKT